MCVCMYIYMYICIYTYVCIYTCIQMYAYIYIFFFYKSLRFLPTSLLSWVLSMGYSVPWASQLGQDNLHRLSMLLQLSWVL